MWFAVLHGAPGRQSMGRCPYRTTPHYCNTGDCLALELAERSWSDDRPHDQGSLRRKRLMNEARQALLALRIAHLAQHAEHDQGAAVIGFLRFEDFPAKLFHDIGVLCSRGDELAHGLALLRPGATCPIDKTGDALGGRNVRICEGGR